METNLKERDLKSVGMVEEDELSFEDLQFVRGDYAFREEAASAILAHPELYRETAVDKAVAEIIAMEEQNASMENVSQGMRR